MASVWPVWLLGDTVSMETPGRYRLLRFPEPHSDEQKGSVLRLGEGVGGEGEYANTESGLCGKPKLSCRQPF